MSADCIYIQIILCLGMFWGVFANHVTLHYFGYFGFGTLNNPIWQIIQMRHEAETFFSSVSCRRRFDDDDDDVRWKQSVLLTLALSNNRFICWQTDQNHHKMTISLTWWTLQHQTKLSLKCCKLRKLSA